MKRKQLLSLILAAVTGLSMAACGGGASNQSADNKADATESGSGSNSGTTDDGSEDGADESQDEGSEAEGNESEYDAASSKIYDDTMGDFYSLYESAAAEEDLSKRYANMAISEAKLLESAVLLPTSTRGGTYAVSRVAYRTGDYTLWGNDDMRFHSLIVAKDPIKAEDREEMKKKWAELKGTGTYRDWVKDFLKEKGYELQNAYGYPYSSDPVTWDVLSTFRAADSDVLVQTYDGLLEYNSEGDLAPALAESYDVSTDGLTYTFHLRKGVKWVDSQGREVDEVTADDFVAGMQHVYDTKSELTYLVNGLIVNATEYGNGEVSDFKEVGVKAEDDQTLVYTLTKPCSYFTTMLGYGIFAPMSRTYYESQGGKFGAEFDSSASDYKYGTSPDTIVYNGPFVVTNATEKNSIVFKKNDAYYNPDLVTVDTVTFYFNDGSDATKSYKDMLAGTLSGCNLNTSAMELAKKDGNFDKYAYVADNDATTYNSFCNLNREVYANVNDNTAAVSTKTDEQKEATKKAMLNVHFRRAIAFAVDRANYNGQSTGEDVKEFSLRNTYTPWNFVQIPEDVTVSINGTDTTFKAGTNYGEIVQAQIDADGVAIKAYDKNADNGIGSGDGYDGWYNPEEAKKELEQAISELSAEGIEISKDNPILLDMPYPSSAEMYTNRANAYKQSVEKALDGAVVINLIDAVDFDNWLYCGYQTTYGNEANYDLYDLSGWGPDYGDPSTYLDTFLPDYNGSMTRCLGIF